MTAISYLHRQIIASSNYPCGKETSASILAIGFRDPTEEDQDPKAIAQEIVRAAERNFWPSIFNNTLSVQVEVRDPIKNLILFSNSANEGDRKEFVACLRAYQQEACGSELNNPGDIAEVPIELTIPARIDGSAPLIRAEASLVVRLAEESRDKTKDVNQIASFRGPGMVINYQTYTYLSQTQRPFHGILVCGKARRMPNKSDIALDEFLRAAEPPEHKNWVVTPKLKVTYKRGYKQLLDELRQRVKDVLKDLVSAKPQEGTDGPRLLMKLFPLGDKSNLPSSPRNPITLKNPDAKFVNGRWEFSGRLAVRSDNSKKWQAALDLRFQAEDASDSSGGVIDTFVIDKNAEAKGVETKVENGVGVLRGPASVRQVDFSGKTDPTKYPTDAKRATVSLDFRPTVVEEH